jgi:thiaminase
VDAVFAATAPCARLYGFLACQLSVSHPAWPGSPYAKWIESYSSPDYLVGLKAYHFSRESFGKVFGDEGVPTCVVHAQALPNLKEKLLDKMEGRSDYSE